MKTQNLAQSFISRYESEYFKNEYLFALNESFANNKGDILRRLYDYFNASNYETQNYFTYEGLVSKETCKKVYDFISDNFESFVKSFNGYYIGYTSLESISFGEQEEQLTGIYNHATGKEYGKRYLKKLFSENDFYVSGEYAYYNLSGGLHVELCCMAEEINEILKG